MNLRSLLGGSSRRDSNLENPTVDVAAAIIGQLDAASAGGIAVTPEKALGQVGIYACVRLIAEDVASLPFPVYERSGRSRIRVPGDTRWPLLNDSPNPEMYAMELMEMTVGHANLWGSGYQYVQFNNAGLPAALWPLRPDRTQRARGPNKELVYVTHLDSGEPKVLDASEVIEVRAFLGKSPIKVAREAIAVGMSAQEYAARFWANDARPGGVITIEKQLDQAQFDEFKARWNAGHQGLKRSHLVGILTNGATWQEVGIPPEDAQFLQTRKFTVREQARLYRVPPHKIADLEGTVTHASIAEQAVDYVVSGLRPWVVRVEQAVKMKLFSADADRARSLYPQLLIDGLLRGDQESRYRAYSIGIMWGFLSRTDVREYEDLPEVDGLDEFLVPANMLPAGATAADVLAAARHIGFEDTVVKQLASIMSDQGIRPDDPVGRSAKAAERPPLADPDPELE